MPASRLLGQQTAETLLARAVLRERVGHAYLFLAPPNCGKATLARLFAQAINCERQPAVAEADAGYGSKEVGKQGSPAEPAAGSPTLPHPHTSTLPHAQTGLRLAPCGECQSCRRIAAGTHPEVIEIRPESKSGQNISIEQVRDLRKNASLKAKLGRRRVYLLPNAELMNEASSNTLLKTLEEPGPDVVLLLCAPSPNHVLPTIRSRCQVVRLNLCSPEEIRDRLTAGGTTPQIAEELARASGGRPGLAINWAETPLILKGRRAVLDVFHRALASQAKAARDPALGLFSLRLGEELRALAAPDPDSEERARPAKTLHSDNLEIGLGYLRDLLLLVSGGDPDRVQNRDRLTDLQFLAGYTTPERVLEDIHTVRQAQQLLERNVGVQLVLERMFWALISGPISLPAGLFEELAV